TPVQEIGLCEKTQDFHAFTILYSSKSTRASLPYPLPISLMYCRGVYTGFSLVNHSPALSAGQNYKPSWNGLWAILQNTPLISI
ncbi:MAG: hypothetical protein ACQES0_11310, partial [Bacteroidota bacterium]